MSTLEGAVPLGLGITKLRLWDELHRAHCETLQQSHPAHSSFRSMNRSHTAPNDQITLQRQVAGPILESSPSPYVFRCASCPATDASDMKVEQSDGLIAPEQPQVMDAASVSASCAASVSGFDLQPASPTPFSDWFFSNHRRDSQSEAGTSAAASVMWTNNRRDSQGVLMPPPPPKPGPSLRKPPPLVARIKAKARRAKRKQQKAEYRRRLFLAHMVQATRQARQQSAAAQAPASTAADATPMAKDARKVLTHQECTPALSLFPERLGVDLASFVEIVFDTDAQSSEITAPSDISDDELARATKTEIETRKRLEGADVVVPKGVFRWMVARDFAERWPQKVQAVRKNPWPGLEEVWGLPSDVGPGERKQDRNVASQRGGPRARDEEPMRWQSGRRSRFIRRKEGRAPKSSQLAAATANAQFLATDAPGGPMLHRSSSDHLAVANVPNEAAPPEAGYSLNLSNTISSESHPDGRPVGQSLWPIIDEPLVEDLFANPSGGNDSGAPHTNSCFEPCIGPADSFLSSWDWSTALSCSHPTALPPHVAGLPIVL